jgi:hypothetical protein
MMVKWRGKLRHLVHYIILKNNTMIAIARNILGESVPVLQPDTTNMFAIDGSIAHAESAKLPTGIYRLAVRESTDDLGVMVAISLAGTSATTAAGMWMPQGSVEYVVLEEGSIISVIDGKVNVTPFK